MGGCTGCRQELTHSVSNVLLKGGPVFFQVLVYVSLR